MPFVKIQKKPDMFPFFREILEHGYHVFSMEHAKLPDYYPNSFPDYPGVDLQNLRVGEVITIRVQIPGDPGHGFHVIPAGDSI